MKRQLVILLPVCLLMLCALDSKVVVVKAIDGFPSEMLTEFVNVYVNCTTADVNTNVIVMSSNTSLMHFPSGVDMERTELTDAVVLSLTFSTSQSFLVYVFNTTDLGAARSLADTVKPSIETAFSTTFTWASTGPSDGLVNVTYIGSGKADLIGYTESLMSLCLREDLGGFSLTFPKIVNETSGLIVVLASKESGGFEWTYSLLVNYQSTILPGPGPHKIDILNLLNVDSLEPSPYAYVSDSEQYASMVMVYVQSTETPSYVACEPNLATPPVVLRGWYVSGYGGVLMGYFSFSDDPTPVSALSLTFSGTVVPEFSPLALLALLFALTTIALIAKKQIHKP